MDREMLWLEDLYFSLKQRIEDKNVLWIYVLQTINFSHLRMLIDGLEWCGLLVDYCGVFISCLDSHSDGTHSLQRIHWWASDNAEFLQICFHEETNHILDGLRVIKFSFWVHCSF